MVISRAEVAEIAVGEEVFSTYASKYNRIFTVG
jgi:hypothetical protein